MLALFQAVTDGQEWREMLKPLMSEISPWMALPFCVRLAGVQVRCGVSQAGPGT